MEEYKNKKGFLAELENISRDTAKLWQEIDSSLEYDKKLEEFEKKLTSLGMYSRRHKSEFDEEEIKEIKLILYGLSSLNRVFNA